MPSGANNNFERRIKMTEQNAIATTNNKIESETVRAAREIASRLKYMISNGNKLTDQEVYALAHYSAANGLNPFAGECYYIPGTGPCPGVAGWRTKAQEQMEYEAKLANQNGGNFWCEYFHADPTDCNFDPQKDIAYMVILHDSVSRKRWTDSVKEIAMDFVKIGVPFFDAFDKARELIGAEPITISYGVVFSTESFAKDGKPEKFDRHERAKKRGEKLCLRKRFPRIHLPEPEGLEDFVESDNYRIISDDQEHQPMTKERREEDAKIFHFGEEAEQEPNKSDTADSQTTASMTLDDAMQMVSKDGELYGTRSDEKLRRVRDNPKSPADNALAAKLILEDRARKGVVID